MSQPYDIEEYWHQFDDRSVWRGFDVEANVQQKVENAKLVDDTIETMDYIVEMTEEETGDIREWEEYKTPNLVKPVLTMYGMKRKRNENEKPKLDEVVSRLQDTFDAMKETVK